MGIKAQRWQIHFTGDTSMGARGELAKIRGKYFSAAYIDCSKCYERVNHIVAATAAIETGCDPTIVALSFN
eukprot:9808880-Heterocapsa_arctica.AAC.1